MIVDGYDQGELVEILQEHKRNPNREGRKIWREFYTRLKPRITNYLRGRFNFDNSTIEGIYQETLTNVFENIEDWTPGGSLYGYVRIIARNNGIDRVRKRKNEVDTDVQDRGYSSDESFSGVKANPLESVVSDERRAVLERAMEREFLRESTERS